VSAESSDDVIESRLRGDTGSGTPYRGVRSLAAILPNGRIVWLKVDSALAPVRALGNLGQLADYTARWRNASLQSQREAIVRLSRTIASDTERTLDARIARTGATRRRIVASNRRLDRKLAKAREKHLAGVEKQLRIERESVARLGRRDLWDKLLVLSSLPLFAAYGQSGAPLSANNVALLLTLLVFLVGDQIVDALFGSGESSPYPVRDADAWTYLAPAANLLAGWWLLSDRQNERFVAGRTLFPVERFDRAVHPILPLQLQYRYVGEIDLLRVVALDHQDDFKTFAGVPAVATISSVALSAAGAANGARVEGLTAKVTGGTLTITVTAAADVAVVPSVLDVLEVAWMVDTQEPSTSASTT
jgi:hypothetical protein